MVEERTNPLYDDASQRMADKDERTVDCPCKLCHYLLAYNTTFEVDVSYLAVGRELFGQSMCMLHDSISASITA